MALSDRIEKIKPYFVSFNVMAQDDAAYILLRFPQGWTIPDQAALKANYKVEIAPKQEGIYFVTEISNGTDNLFDCADYIVQFNKNVQERKGLLSQKVKELTELFATEPLDKLKTMYFAFDEKVTAKTKTSSKKVEKEAKPKTEKEEILEALSEPTKPVKEEPKKAEAKEENNEDSGLMSLAKGIVGED